MNRYKVSILCAFLGHTACYGETYTHTFLNYSPISMTIRMGICSKVRKEVQGRDTRGHVTAYMTFCDNICGSTPESITLEKFGQTKILSTSCKDQFVIISSDGIPDQLFFIKQLNNNTSETLAIALTDQEYIIPAKEAHRQGSKSTPEIHTGKYIPKLVSLENKWSVESRGNKPNNFMFLP
jgi:hypothetical protein